MQAGQTIAGKYRLIQILGTGGMATVWSATNVFTERQFAVKFLLPGFAKTPEAARRFLQEAKISGRVQHPNVIEIMDVGQTDEGALFLVMELLTGISLEGAMHRQNPSMSVYEFVGVMLDVARGLAAAQRAGVIHRDLKPTNIFMHTDREGIAVPKVLDFGVSKFLLEDGRDNSLTVAGTVLGSPMYMSPEQAMGVPDIDNRTDIFAFGAILFEGLCGFRCFDAPNFNALIVTIATQQPKSIDAAAPYLPQRLRAVVRDCCMTDRKKRLPSFEVVIERLNAILPELEKSPLRLPAPIGAAPPADPDATNAMPAIVRPSDRAPSFHSVDVPPSGGSPAPWAGTVSKAPTKKRFPILPFAVGGVLLACVVVAGGLYMAAVRRPRVAAAAGSATATVTVTPSATVPVVPPSVTASVAADPPSMSVNALPVSSGPKAKGYGRVTIDAAPQWCNVTIDGRAAGPTPLANYELSAGSHIVKCETSGGLSHSFPVQVYEGQTTRHKFTTGP